MKRLPLQRRTLPRLVVLPPIELRFALGIQHVIPRESFPTSLEVERVPQAICTFSDMTRRFATATSVVTHHQRIIPTFKGTHHLRDGVSREDVGEGRVYA